MRPSHFETRLGCRLQRPARPPSHPRADLVWCPPRLAETVRRLIDGRDTEGGR